MSSEAETSLALALREIIVILKSLLERAYEFLVKALKTDSVGLV
jgi:hypothetical protein